MWKNIVERDRPQMTKWRMRIVCCIRKATNTHNMYYLLPFHCNSGYRNAPHRYVISKCPVVSGYRVAFSLPSPPSKRFTQPAATFNKQPRSLPFIHSRQEITYRHEATISTVLQAVLLVCGLHIVTKLGVSTLLCLLQNVA